MAIVGKSKDDWSFNHSCLLLLLFFFYLLIFFGRLVAATTAGWFWLVLTLTTVKFENKDGDGNVTNATILTGSGDLAAATYLGSSPPHTPTCYNKKTYG